MGPIEKTIILVKAKINAPIEKVWKCWINPEDIVKWNNASDDWQTLWAENDLKPGGKFNYRMEAKDGSMGFNFAGAYDNVILLKQIIFTIEDGRKVKINFSTQDNRTEVIESFEAENDNPVDLQQGGWQAILDNFKKYVEAHNKKIVHIQ
jgi:uncharacterized protein YndB with AHSA1/START domain